MACSSACQTSQAQTQRNVRVEMQTESLLELPLKAAGKKRSDFILSLQSNYFCLESGYWGFAKCLLRKYLFRSHLKLKYVSFLLPAYMVGFCPAPPVLLSLKHACFPFKTILKDIKTMKCEGMGFYNSCKPAVYPGAQSYLI